MQRTSVSVVLLVIVSMIAVMSIAAQPEKEPSLGLLSELHKGQAVALKDLGCCYEITVFANGPEPLGFEVVEAGRDFVAVRDVTGTRQIRIPFFAIKSVTTMTVGAK